MSHACACPILIALATACCADLSARPEPTAAEVTAVPTPDPTARPLAMHGVVTARVSELVAAPAGGRVIRVSARSGQRVAKGDPIAELDPALLAEHLRGATAAEDAARAHVAGLRGEVAAAARVLTLGERLASRGITSHEETARARLALAGARAAADRASAQLREAASAKAALELQLAQTRLVAPIDGVVSLVKARPGDVVAAGAAVARVFDPEVVMVRFQVHHDRRRDVAIDTAVEIVVDDLSWPLRATVTAVAADLEPPLDFAVAEAELDDKTAARALQIGTPAEVRVVAHASSN